MADSDPARMLAELSEVLRDAPDILPPALASANTTARFHCGHKVRALEEWARAQWRVDPAMDVMPLFGALAEKHRQEPAPLVAMALEYKRCDLLQPALNAANRALSRARQDLYCQEVALSITSALDPSVPTPAVTQEYLNGRFCIEPFRTLEPTPDGSTFVCCPDWLPVPIGNINKDKADELWNSDVAQALRDSIVDRSFRYCSKTSCPLIAGRTLPEAESAVAQETIEKFAKRSGAAIPKPGHLILSHDRSCNLSCPSCRVDFILANKTQQAKLDEIATTVILPLLRDATSVKITGSGDPFGSNHFRNIIKRINKRDFPNLTIDLHTNAQLFDERAWNDLEMEGTVGYTQISIDAAQPETYKWVRRGGDFGRLLKNLAFVRELRQREEIKRLDLSFVVQARNFREMPAFVELAQETGADCVSFSMIRNWGTFESAEFAKELIGSPEHPDHAEFLEVLRHPNLAADIVFLGNLTDHAAA